ncbi:hypothetical protein GCM10010249_10000 [Streptomyces roseolilacinus]|uniref:Uncharacterized protein n=1 Tax=Streptomyces roseolilacinus TaxID=66904 RepID=A0A918EJ29_9ACTN|nr:hypothetical protein GCM10010249_10000 [Streptomyces roseolilacinus]
MWSRPPGSGAARRRHAGRPGRTDRPGTETAVVTDVILRESVTTAGRPGLTTAAPAVRHVGDEEGPAADGG